MRRPRFTADSPHLADPAKERLGTAANVITAVRTLASSALALLAVDHRSLTLLVVALAVYWVGDIADGAVARLFHHETRFGAVLDILCDRLNCATFYLGLAFLKPELAWPILLYLVVFMTIDALNSLAFLAWPVRSPNYFHEVDDPIWRWNWSKPAKALTSSLFAVILLLTGWVWLGFVWAGAVAVVKIWTLVRLMRIGLPIPAAELHAEGDA